MRVRDRFICIVVASISLLVGPANAHCAEAPAQPAAPLLPPAKFTIYPASAPRPSLKYQLLPPFGVRMRGNAAVYYGKVTAEQQAVFGNRAVFDKFEVWRDMPLEALRKDDVQTNIGEIEDMLYRAARCDSCDWQLPVREEAFYTIRLPELQESRQFARLLSTRARIQIARGEFDGAIRTFQSSFALAHNLGNSETIVGALIGTAVCGIMSDQLAVFIQQPDAPNLYWALSTLPNPLVDYRPAAEAEWNAFSTAFPEARDLDADHSPDEWRRILTQYCAHFLEYSEDKDLQNAGAEQLVVDSLKRTAEAKQELIERGHPRDKVEAMSAAQAVLVYSVERYYELRDDTFRWFLLPFDESVTGTAHAAAELAQAEGDKREIIPVAKIILPVMPSLRMARVLTQRQIAIFRVIEALRIFGAEHDGRLPATLDDIKEVPIPNDPMTGKPFGYRLENGTATLETAPISHRPNLFEIKMLPRP